MPHYLPHEPGMGIDTANEINQSESYTVHAMYSAHDYVTPGANIIWSAISTMACLYWLLGLNIITSLARHRPEEGRQCVQR